MICMAKFVMMNTHYLTHVVECVRRQGHYIHILVFPFESFNKIYYLLSMEPIIASYRLPVLLVQLVYASEVEGNRRLRCNRVSRSMGCVMCRSFIHHLLMNDFGKNCHSRENFGHAFFDATPRCTTLFAVLFSLFSLFLQTSCLTDSLKNTPSSASSDFFMMSSLVRQKKLQQSWRHNVYTHMYRSWASFPINSSHGRKGFPKEHDPCSTAHTPHPDSVYTSSS